MARASSLLTRPSGPAASAWSPTRAGRGWAFPGVNQSVYRAELLAVTLALERLRWSARVVSDCKGVVRVVAALRAKVRRPGANTLTLRSGSSGLVTEPRSSGLRHTRRKPSGGPWALLMRTWWAMIGLKEALWQRWRDHAEKFRLFWGAFGPPWRGMCIKKGPPSNPRRWNPRFSGQNPQRNWRVSAGCSWNRPFRAKRGTSYTFSK